MGLRFRKSIRMPGGLRLNLSKSGVGASWGVKGFRVGVGPRGSRVTAYVPSTGVGWSGTFGSGGAQRIGDGRAARRAQRDLEARGREIERMQERDRAAYEVAVFENHLALLTSLHKEAWIPWNWSSVENSGPPAPPVYTGQHEAAAIAAIHGWMRAYPSEAHARALADARQHDAYAHQQALAQHGADYARWDWLRRLAHGINSGDVAAFEAVVAYLSPFPHLQDVGIQIEPTVPDPRVAFVRFVAHAPQVVPSETLSLTPTGRLSRQQMPVQRFWAIYQDHVCSAVFRLAREMFALVPVEVTLVHAATMNVNPATGNYERQTIVSAAFTRTGLSAIDFERIDPSQALERFPHAMDLRPRGGFEPVDEIEIDDLVDAESQEA